MDMQSIIVLALFAVATAYLARMLYTTIRPKKGNACGANCKCGMDFSQLEEKK